MNMTDILKGEIPYSLEEKTMAAKDFLYFSKRIVPVTSLLIASARRDHFENDTASWARWCRENLEMEGSDRDHRRKIGEMLLDARGDTIVYNTLFKLAFDKLLSLTRLKTEEIAAFLSHYAVKDMTREEVRNAVSQWLNEEVKERSSSTVNIPGLTAALGAISDMTPDALCVRISDPAMANMALNSSLMLLDAGLNFHKTQVKNVEFLQKLKLELLDEVRELEQTINECCTQQMDCCTQQVEIA